MASSLSNLVNNIKEFIEWNVNLGTLIRNVKRGIKYCKYCDCFLKYTNFKDDLIEYKCLTKVVSKLNTSCNKSYQQKFDWKLKERLFNIYQFSNHGNNKFTLLLQKVVYSYEYIDDS